MKTPLRFIVFALVILSSCSVLKPEEPEKEIRSFLAEFQNSLTKPDDEILSRFRTKQSREVILSVVRILQNKDPFIVCDVFMTSAVISQEGTRIRVTIPVTFRVQDLDSNDSQVESLTLELARKATSFEIIDVQGESFYKGFTTIKNGNKWEAQRKLALQERLWIYEKAQGLEARFDSVIWFARYGPKNYFYVVTGHWENYFLDFRSRKGPKPAARMGLTDGDGDIIIPMEYDLIGTVSFNHQNIVEVIKDGKVGYFNVETKQLVAEPVYDFIVPTHWLNVSAIVKQDTTYGWLDKDFRYTTGFPSDRAKEWITSFEFLKNPIQLKADRYMVCEIPSPKQAGSGLIIPAAYLSKHGIFNEIESGLMTTQVPLNGWTEYKETRSSFLEKISGSLRAVVTSVRERYLEGREEFYDSNTIVFVDSKQDTLKVASIPGSEVSLRAVSPTLLEVRAPHSYWFREYEAGDEDNLYAHTYFSIADKIQELPSNRLYAQTQYVKLDSSYLVGNFTRYNRTTEREETSQFLSVNTITYMRDEILAAYGYQFPTPERTEQFKNNGNWYTPRYTSLEQVTENLDEIDRYNLEFLNKILSLLQAKPV